MFNHYEINISLEGQHFLATAPRSIQDEEKLELVLKVLRKKFPSQEGYCISVTYWKITGQTP